MRGDRRVAGWSVAIEGLEDGFKCIVAGDEANRVGGGGGEYRGGAARLRFLRTGGENSDG